MVSQVGHCADHDFIAHDFRVAASFNPRCDQSSLFSCMHKSLGIT
jgi:hypothetical protein